MKSLKEWNEFILSEWQRFQLRSENRKRYFAMSLSLRRKILQSAILFSIIYFCLFIPIILKVWICLSKAGETVSWKALHGRLNESTTVQGELDETYDVRLWFCQHETFQKWFGSTKISIRSSDNMESRCWNVTDHVNDVTWVVCKMSGGWIK